MTFDPCLDLTVAEWITASDEPWWSLVTLGPPGFPAYARLRFIPDPAYEGQSENDAVRHSEVIPEIDQLRVAVETLLQHTDAPAEGRLLIWDGWGEEAFPDRAWCITQDVDPHWAGIGAEQAAIDPLVNDPRLDVVPVDPDQKMPFYYERRRTREGITRGTSLLRDAHHGSLRPYGRRPAPCPDTDNVPGHR